jgi:hypothetical protein
MFMRKRIGKGIMYKFPYADHKHMRTKLGIVLDVPHNQGSEKCLLFVWEEWKIKNGV